MALAPNPKGTQIAKQYDGGGGGWEGGKTHQSFNQQELDNSVTLLVHTHTALPFTEERTTAELKLVTKQEQSSSEQLLCKWARMGREKEEQIRQHRNRDDKQDRGRGNGGRTYFDPCVDLIIGGFG